MDDPVEAFANAETPGEFWLSLGAVLTDEVVIAEAQAAGMDWPDLDVGRQRLILARRVMIASAAGNDWIRTADAELLAHDDPQFALAAARPWIEREQRRAFAATRAPDRR
jgi:hypothetical protein